jgi:5'-nucleotidase
MQKVLVVNDDGYKSAGIRAMLKELDGKYDVTAVAPANEQSWMAKSITGHRELTLTPTEHAEFKGYTVDGTPADCTQIGMYQVLHEKPDLVVSGLNIGANIGHSHILSSGTVGAALEAGLQGIPAFASSVWNFKKQYPGADFNDQKFIPLLETAAEITRKIVDKVMAAGFPANTQVIAINLPYNVKPDAPWAVTWPHREAYGSVFAGNGTIFKNAGTPEIENIRDQKTDIAALLKGYVSIVPIAIELTSEAGRQDLATILGISILD